MRRRCWRSTLTRCPLASAALTSSSPSAPISTSSPPAPATPMCCRCFTASMTASTTCPPTPNTWTPCPTLSDSDSCRSPPPRPPFHLLVCTPPPPHSQPGFLTAFTPNTLYLVSRNTRAEQIRLRGQPPCIIKSVLFRQGNSWDARGISAGIVECGVQHGTGVQRTRAHCGHLPPDCGMPG